MRNNKTTQIEAVPEPVSMPAKSFIPAEEFSCHVAVANLAVDLARVQGRSDSAEAFIEEAIHLICQAREMLGERKIGVIPYLK